MITETVAGFHQLTFNVLSYPSVFRVHITFEQAEGGTLKPLKIHGNKYLTANLTESRKPRS